MTEIQPDLPPTGLASHPSIIPEPRSITRAELGQVLAAGWRDFTRAPLYGIAFSAVYVLGGLIMYAIFSAAAAEYWFIPIAVGFPILAPFAATGLYEVSRRLETGEALTPRAVFAIVFAQKDRQVPSMAMFILLVFMFWVFIAHTIFALFFGLTPITGSTLSMLLSANGLMMLLVGSAIGGIMAALFYALTVISLPLLLDREVDFITAMITSFGCVTRNPAAMVGWAALIALALFIGMLPLFLGLFVVLPVFGHATWHLYRRLLPAD
ncbi:hypothetical protein C4N9_05385 [Pararhodobacter marinus]|uniref:DUF2189 domain-containing protein n=1 Tax=Pararhodobacter marinus TaxID=2184063 RepID=A0A2U2CE26_9RHOB|nr:DUF2189 domain-containing protein [Pararhodobacter marinus]PWE30136.1 hypothetical protein C4N9_05385 [Pararhodobacter marinus]